VAEPIRELWVGEYDGAYWTSKDHKDGCDDSFRRFVPAPEWELYDPENPPPLGKYLCECTSGDGNYSVVVLTHSFGSWHGAYVGFTVRRYTPVPQPPEWVP
jgi:hypothetical protein